MLNGEFLLCVTRIWDWSVGLSLFEILALSPHKTQLCCSYKVVDGSLTHALLMLCSYLPFGSMESLESYFKTLTALFYKLFCLVSRRIACVHVSRCMMMVPRLSSSICGIWCQCVFLAVRLFLNLWTVGLNVCYCCWGNLVSDFEFIFILLEYNTWFHAETSECLKRSGLFSPLGKTIS